MAKTNQDFEMWAGDHQRITFTLEDVEDLTGSTIKWILAKNTPPREEILVEKNTDNVGEITIGTEENTNQFTVYLLPSDTLDLDREYYHEAEITDLLGRVSTVATGYAWIYGTAIDQ